MWLLSVIMAAYAGSGFYYTVVSSSALSRKRAALLGGAFFLLVLGESIWQLGAERGAAFAFILVVATGPLVLMTAAVNKNMVHKLARLFGGGAVVCLLFLLIARVLS